MIESGDRTGPQDEPQNIKTFGLWDRQTMLSSVDHPTVWQGVQSDAFWSSRYAFMLVISAGIAILGLLLSSPAVLIGALLVSPLMGPVIGLGFSLATLNAKASLHGLLAILAGCSLVVAITAGIVLLSPLQDITAEILARTRPNLFDLLVAIFAALAGAYAVIRGRGNAIVGVPLALALIPQLAVVGFGLATGNTAIAAGAFWLFVSNLLVIVLLSAVVARFYGFGAAHSPQQPRWQSAVLVMMMIILAVPLTLSLRQIGWEVWASRTMRNEVQSEFGDRARIANLDPDFADKKLKVRTTVYTDVYRDKAKDDLERRLTRKLGRPISLELNQILVNRSAAKVQLGRARAEAGRDSNDLLARADVAARMALVAGVDIQSVSVDPVVRQASVRLDVARPLPELMLAEARLSEDSPGWNINLIPVPGSLPEPLFQENSVELAADQEIIIQSAAWALLRMGTDRARLTPRRVTGERAGLGTERAQRLAEIFREAGIDVEIEQPSNAQPDREREQGRAALRSIVIDPLPPLPKPPEDPDAAYLDPKKRTVEV